MRRSISHEPYVFMTRRLHVRHIPGEVVDQETDHDKRADDKKKSKQPGEVSLLFHPRVRYILRFRSKLTVSNYSPAQLRRAFIDVWRND